jgi:membrane associated rhomboid family serine protease
MEKKNILMTYYDQIKTTLQRQSNLTQLLIVNLSLFILTNIIDHFLKLNLLSYLVLEAGDLNYLYKPWTLLTYQFTHLNLGHFIVNIIMLFFVGNLYLQTIGQRLIYVYVMSGLFAALFIIILSMIFQNQFHSSFLIGCSASVIGLLCASARYSPNLMISVFFGTVTTKLKYVAIGVVLITSIIDFSSNMGGKIAHIGGALFGVMYGYYLQKGTDIFNFSFMVKHKKKHLKIVSYDRGKDYEYNEERALSEQRMNELLDKVIKSGYQSLTKGEKDELNKYSQKP